MPSDPWDITSLPSYKALSQDDISALWRAELPETREHNPALWDLQMGFFEDAIVDISRRPGHLVVSPRELLKQMKRAGREPPCAKSVITELFRKGDIVRADSLKVAESASASNSTGVFGTLRASLGRYLWSTKEPDAPELEDAIVPKAALATAAEKAAALLGPIATSEIHTLKSFAERITGGNERDAEAVISHIVAQGQASVLYTDPTPDNPTPMFGVRLGKGMPSASDKGLLQTKYAQERMKDVAMHLEEEIAVEKAAAISAAKSGNKRDALTRVQKKAVLEKKLGSTQATVRKLSDVLMAVDEAESNKEAVLALEIGMDSLRATTATGVTADRVDDIAANFDELMAEQQDMRVALQQLTTSNEADNAQYEAELEEILREADNQEKLNAPSLAVPRTEPGTAATAANGGAEKTAEEHAEEELQKLLAESGIEGVPLPATAFSKVEDPEQAKEPSRSHGRIVAPAP